MKLVLASESPYRRALLDRLQLDYSACAHRVDERQHSKTLPADITLPDLALSLASAKAQSLAEEYAGAYIIASDQIAEIEGEVLHKPGTRSNAIQQLSKLQGREHRLLTAVALHFPNGETRTTLDEHKMVMRALSAGEVERYVDSEEPYDCCGSYKIESLGISLFDAIVGDDFTAITGLPLLSLSRLLRKAGFPIP
jgi:septum formation protein